jgi:hypothetical protein
MDVPDATDAKCPPGAAATEPSHVVGDHAREARRHFDMEVAFIVDREFGGGHVERPTLVRAVQGCRLLGYCTGCVDCCSQLPTLSLLLR